VGFYALGVLGKDDLPKVGWGVLILVGIAVSFDFIVPVGTPPNAIAYETGYIRVKDMLKAGIAISIIGALVVSMFAMFW
jgi:sodium-dependent dicarboxylate transporter 2/3/5